MKLTQANTGTVQLRTCELMLLHPSSSIYIQHSALQAYLPRKGETSWTTSQTFYTGCLNTVDLPASAALTACTSSQTAFLEVCAGYTFCILSFTLQLAQLTRLMDLNRNVARYQATTPVESPAFPHNIQISTSLCVCICGACQQALQSSAELCGNWIWTLPRGQQTGKSPFRMASRLAGVNLRVWFGDVWCFIFPSALRTL